ncbi:MAG TPA: hypothetical protein VKE70_02635 [Candidatus Solibacter sp.]|nr:hypothetical protein [Candidatus Solibacter sp.]
MNALQKTLAIIALLCLVSQTIRHAYLLWVEPRGSVLDKYDRPLKNEITSATSLDELVRRYEPLRQQADSARAEAAKSGNKIGYEQERGTEPFKSESALHEAITDWEQKSKEIHGLRFYWFIGLALCAIGLVTYQTFNRWLGFTLMIAGFAEFIYWTSPTFLGGGTREFDRLLVNKLAYSVISLVLLLALIFMLDIFAQKGERSTQ